MDQINWKVVEAFNRKGLLKDGIWEQKNWKLLVEFLNHWACKILWFPIADAIIKYPFSNYSGADQN